MITTITTISCYTRKNSKWTSPVKVMTSVFWDSKDEVEFLDGDAINNSVCYGHIIKTVKTTNLKGFAKYYDESSHPA